MSQSDSFQTNRFRLLGIGGAGSRVVQHLQHFGLPDVGFAALNTDVEELKSSTVDRQLQLGSRSSRGLGAGGDPEVGRAAAEEAGEELRELCRGAQLVFVIAGMGGGTGTGAAPTVARMAREAGALVLALVTLPFSCEGSRRQRQARRGIEELKATADVVLTLANDRVLSLIDESTSLVETFRCLDSLLAQSVRGVWWLTGRPGLINVDFADLRGLVQERHAESFFAYAEAQGEARSREAVERLVMSPLLESGAMLRGTSAALVSVVAGENLTMGEVNRVMELLRRECEGAELLLGASVDPGLGDRLSVTLIGVQRPRPNHVGLRGEVAEPPEEGDAVDPLEPSETVETDFFRRQPPPRRPRSRFVAPPPELSAEERTQFLQKGGRLRSRMKQAMLPLEVVSKGRFEKSEPTVYQGEDLDVPTFVRRGIVLN